MCGSSANLSRDQTLIGLRLFFDLDGTLTDPRLGITTCLQYALAGLDEPVPAPDALLWCIGPPLRESFVRLVGEKRADAGVGLYRERFGEIGLFENEVYIGVPQALEALKEQGIVMYVASSKALVFVERILTKFELARYFDQAFGAELDGTRADKTALLDHALRVTQANPSESVMIGDREHDAIGALNNGMRFVGASYGYGSREELERAGSEHFVDHPSELPDVLRDPELILTR